MRNPGWGWTIAVSAVVLASCFGDCSGGENGGTGGGGGGSSSKTLKYQLVEAGGTLSVTGTHVSGTCTQQTTSSVNKFALPTTQATTAATFSASGGLGISVDFKITSEPRVGTEQCTTSRACPSFADQPQTFTSFLLVQDPEPPVVSGKPAPTVVVPKVNFPLPRLCDGTRYEVADVVLRAKPISVEQLLTGRFVLEGDGTAPIHLPVPDEGVQTQTLAGTITFSYRFVFQTASYVAPGTTPVAPTLTTWEHCTLDDPPTFESLTAAIAAFDAQGAEIPLNPTGCRRLQVARDAGTTTISQLVIRGTRFSADPVTGAVSTAPDERTTYVRELGANSVKDRSDFDGDGFFETTNTWTLDGSGAWLKLVTEELQPGTATVLTRTTLTPLATPGRNHVVAERLVAGSLQIEREYDTPQEQRSCFSGTGGGAGGGAGGGTGGAGGGAAVDCSASVRNCNSGEKDAIRARMARVLKKGKDCIEKTGFKAFDYEGKGLTLIATSSLNLKCNTNPACDFGGFNTKVDSAGKHDLILNLTKTGVGASAELDSTIFHELLHSDGRFGHDDALTEAAFKAGKLQMADRTYACEAMCFKKPDACTCIRCLDPQVSEVLNDNICKECEAKYGSTKTCAKRYEKGPDGGTAAVASAVAAWCKGSQTLCDTKVECDTQCVAATGSNCMPIRATCDPTCN